jgi:hypothetical protein
MKYLSILLVMTLVWGMAGAAWYPQKVNVPVTNYDNITLVDDKYMFFGTGTDASLRYDSAMDKIYFNDTPIYLEEAVSLGAGFTGGAISGTTGYFSSTLGAAGTTGLNYTTVTDIRAADDAYFTDDVGIGGTAALNETTATTVTATGLIHGADGRFTDDALVDDDFFVDGTATLNDAVVNTTLDVNGATTAENISITQGKRIVLNTAGTQFIEHNESGNYFGIWGNPLAVDGFRWTGTLAPTSGSDMIAVGGASDIDYSLSGGVTKTGTGPVSLNGDTTVATTKTLAVADADKLTVGGVIIPQEMIITIPIGASEVDQTAFIADDAWQITKIEEVHSVAQNTAYPNTGNLSITKCTGTQAPNAGSYLHNTTMWLNSTINTVVTPALNASTGALNLADGNRLCLDFNGTMSTFAGGCVTIHLKRI